MYLTTEEKINAAFCLAILLGQIALFVVTLYVAFHFICKFW